MGDWSYTKCMTKHALFDPGASELELRIYFIRLVQTPSLKHQINNDFVNC